MIRIGRQRSVVEELHDRGPIEPRSRRDRAAIGELKGCKSPPRDRRTIDDLPGLRSRPDRGPIMGLLEAKIAAILTRNRSEIVADSKPIRKLRLQVMKLPPRRMDSAPRPHQLPTIVGPISPLKTHVLLLCS